MDVNNPYTKMQKASYEYEGTSGRMNQENHRQHNGNPDYWNILVKETEDISFKNKVGLDFGCGCGRNVLNLVDRFKRMDGVDISPTLIETCKINLKDYADKTMFHVCDGVSLSVLNSDSYDFIMSTIVLQHICVYEIRFNYLKEFYRLLKHNGIISIQMGYGEGRASRRRGYYENFYQAEGTNGHCDVRVSDPSELVKDLTNIGFKNIQYEIRPSFSDERHRQWIYMKAFKCLTS